MNRNLRALIRLKSLLYAAMLAGAIFIVVGAIGLGKLLFEFPERKLSLAETICLRAEMRQYLPSEMAKEEASIRALSVKPWEFGDFPVQSAFTIPIERRTETDSVEQHVMEAFQFMKHVKISKRPDRTWYDLSVANIRKIVFDSVSENNLAVVDPSTGTVTIYVQNLGNDLHAVDNPAIYIASTLVHETGHIVAEKNGHNGEGRNLASMILFKAAHLLRIKTDPGQESAFENGGCRTQDERKANALELQFLDDVKASGKYGDLAVLRELSCAYTAELAYITDRFNTITNSLLMALSGVLMVVLSIAVIAARKAVSVFRRNHTF